MRLVTGISIASLVISVVTLALVLMMFIGESGESAETEVELHVPPTPVAIDTPTLNYQVIRGLLEGYSWQDGKGPDCITGAPSADNIRNLRMQDFGISYAHGIWTIQAAGTRCDGLQIFQIEDATGEVTHVQKPK